MAKKIMLVEDDNNLREIYEARLSAEGYEIVAAENGEAALAMAAKERPDMIISDVMMPKISGFEMLDILRNTDSLKNTKIIMLTALGQSEDSQRADSLGADRYLVKSQVTLEDIVKAAHDLLDDPNKLAAVSQSTSDSDITPTENMAVAVAPEVATPPTDTSVAEAPVETIEPVNEPIVTPESVITPEPAPAPDQSETPVAEPVQESVQEPSQEPAADIASQLVTPTTNDAITQDAAVADANNGADAAPAAPAQSSVISIPVTVGDDTSDDPQQSANVDAPAANPNFDIQVVEEPTEESTEETQPVANEASNSPVAAPAPNIEASSEQSAAIAEPAGDQTNAIEAQINQFLQNQDSQETQVDQNQNSDTVAPAPESVSTDQVSSDASPESTPEPVIEIPSLVNNPDVNTTDDSNVELVSEGPADDVPAPEQLDSFSAPVIDAPEGSSVPDPTPVAVESAPVQDTDPQSTEATKEVSAEDNNANQLREAADGLAAASSAEAAAPSASNNRMRSVTPIAPAAGTPNIHQLLALEEAKNGANQAAGATEAPKPNVSAYNPSSSAAPQAPENNNQSIDPNSISL